ncbi:aminotransferase class I/II-fold pyridoxal phosphate-dependent enzyme [Demequina sp. TTPB684]|uniref:MalY/PatB family protein n=1 Tax=unclassified Demequina TaxID=2620311 RepID=UPI001CF18242|nr:MULTISPECIES: aminotransferase class I/II-fold pyridoxal phosphate-dependent enzyme [unclassified Demequina]MCB2411389.1 aminotransferase class I/II-fold pyridoxal phosphate-dependent enzyme [Demequina sp. TTPB684]UPU87768.1 aminotransferase class I/II-fold pyridoxal phosphate-dependent enzyme [Demequina sp. TMPB413]
MAEPNPFDQVSLDRLRERTSAKWRRYDADVLPLWVAEMDVNLAAPIANALEHAVRSGDTGYPGSTPYVEAFVEFARSRWQWPTLDPALVRPVAGVIPGYTDALVQAAGHGGHVVVTSPVYPPFYSYLREAGLTVVEAVLSDQMRIDPVTLDAALAQAGRDTDAGVAVLLCNPHNPGGTVHTKAELEQLASIARHHDATVVADEIHAPLVYSPAQFTPYLSVDGSGIALHSASKAWNLAAMPGALMVFGHEAADAHRIYAAGAHHWPGHFAVIAQTAAYSQGAAWLDAALAGLDANRHVLGSLLAEHLPDVGYRMPDSTYLAWLDCTALGLGDDPAAVFLERGRVALNSGPTFGTGGAGHVRLNFATSGTVLTEAVRRMASAL